MIALSQQHLSKLAPWTHGTLLIVLEGIQALQTKIVMKRSNAPSGKRDQPPGVLNGSSMLTCIGLKWLLRE